MGELWIELHRGLFLDAILRVYLHAQLKNWRSYKGILTNEQLLYYRWYLLREIQSCISSSFLKDIFVYLYS